MTVDSAYHTGLICQIDRAVGWLVDRAGHVGPNLNPEGWIPPILNPESLLVWKMNLRKKALKFESQGQEYKKKLNLVCLSESRILTNQIFESGIRWFWNLNPEAAIHLKFESRIPGRGPPLTGIVQTQGVDRWLPIKTRGGLGVILGDKTLNRGHPNPLGHFRDPPVWDSCV